MNIRFSALAWRRATALASEHAHWWPNRWNSTPTFAQVEAARYAYTRYEHLANELNFQGEALKRAKARLEDLRGDLDDETHDAARDAFRRAEDLLRRYEAVLFVATEALPPINPAFLAPVALGPIKAGLLANVAKDEEGWVGHTPDEDDGCIVHETHSGALSWRIYATGETVIEIHRPKPGRAVGSSAGVTVLVLRVEVNGTATVVQPAAEVPALCRHWDRLLDAATALGVQDAVWAEMPALVSRTLKRQKELFEACEDKESAQHEINCQRAGEIERRADEEILRISKPLIRTARQRAAMGEA